MLQNRVKNQMSGCLLGFNTPRQLPYWSTLSLRCHPCSGDHPMRFPTWSYLLGNALSLAENFRTPDNAKIILAELLTQNKVNACQYTSRHPKCKIKIGWVPRLGKEGRTDSIALDITHDPVTMDLTTPTGFLTACYHATCLRVGAGLLAAPVCSSFVYMPLDL